MTVRLLRLAALGMALVAAVFPFYWILATSLTPEVRMFAREVTWLPLPPTLEHYRAVFLVRPFLVNIGNSLLVAGLTTALCLLVGSAAAFALSRLAFPGKTAILAGILAVSLFPEISLLSPLFLILRRLGLINTYPALIFPYLTFALPLTVWLLTAYFRKIPVDLEEAARIDGASGLQVVMRVLFPLAAPGLATTGILTFIYCWNEFLFALAFTQTDAVRTVPVAIVLFSGYHSVPWGQIMAAVVVVTVPVAALVLLVQRRIVEGLTAGALKG
jgi:multiple sugar transport system permease protein